MTLEVHKFGGTSVGSGDRLVAGAALVRQRVQDGVSVVVVTSAMSGVTSTLVAACDAAAQGRRDLSRDAFTQILHRHEDAVRHLAGESPALLDEVHHLVTGASRVLDAAARLHEVSTRTRDRVLAIGERLAARLFVAALETQGTASVPLDADGFLHTDGRHGAASPLGGPADRHVRAALQGPLDAGSVPVVTGFCGRAPDGSITTLGRGGSDLTATLLAAALGAAEVTIWTDVDGVFTADPGLVPDARVIPHLNYREAAEMSFYGAKVLHPRTMMPVAQARIPVRTRNSFHPERAGTMVDARFTPGSHPVKGITAVRGQALLSIEGKGMSGVPGVAALVFGALADANVSVTMISQSSSEASICLAVPEERSLDAERAIKRATLTHFARGAIDEIIVERGIALIAMVGLGMAQTPGVAARGLAALADAGTNVRAVAQGSSELNLTVAVAEAAVTPALQHMHSAFRLDRRDAGHDTVSRVDLMLVGCGSIGRALLPMVLDDPSEAFARLGLRPTVVGIADRQGYRFAAQGLDRTAVEGLLATKAAGGSVVDDGGTPGTAEDMVKEASGWRLSRPLLVDVSDAPNAEAAMLAALQGHIDIVTANKHPLAGPAFDQLREAAAAGRRSLRAEATVGAGLPVVDTLDMLLDTGDQLREAEGCFSGTLGFVMGAIERGVPLSLAVAQASQNGLTEPDPAQDLSGADVARKATILARWAGFTEAPLTLEGLIPESWGGLDRDTLLERLRDEIDAPLAARVAAARERGHVLRYVAHVTPERIVVGPREVPENGPLGQLRGTDNLVLFRTDRYAAHPLVIVGPGAGIEVTAMGVLGDILRTVQRGGTP